jgi:hypothetical protein
MTGLYQSFFVGPLLGHIVLFIKCRSGLITKAAQG